MMFYDTRCLSLCRIFGTALFATPAGRIAILLLILAPAFASGVLAQGNGFGYGTSLPGTASGPDALFSNPAFLHSPEAEYRFELRFPGASAAIGGGLLNVPVYNRYLTQNRILTPEIQRRMLSEWFPEGGSSRERAGAEAAIAGPGLSYSSGRHAFGLAQQLRGIGQVSATRGIFEAGFGGLDQQLFEERTPLDAQASSAVFMQLAAGYSIRLIKQERSFFFGRPMELYAGAAPALLLGYQGMEANLRSQLQVQGDSLVQHRFTYDLHTHGRLARQLRAFADAKAASGARQNPNLRHFIEEPFADFNEIAGYGFGLNLGLRAKISLSDAFLDAAFIGSGPRELHLSLALTDLGSARFSSDAARFSHADVLEWRGVNISEAWINQEFEGNADDYLEYALQDSLGSDTYLSYQTHEQASTRIQLPARLQLGGWLQAGKAAAGLSFVKGFNESGINSRRLGFSTGLEYKTLGWLPLRAGMQAGGGYGGRAELGAGITTRRFELDASFSTALRASANGSWNGFHLSSRLRF